MPDEIATDELNMRDAYIGAIKTFERCNTANLWKKEEGWCVRM